MTHLTACMRKTSQICKEKIGIKLELGNCGKTDVLLTLAFRVFSFQIALKI